MQIRNTFIIFLVSGFWHGANWTFVAWGFVNALYFMPLMLLGSNRNNIGIVAEGKAYPSLKELGQMSLTFALTCLAWIFFRAESMTQALGIFKSIFSMSLFSIPTVRPTYMILAVMAFFAIEWKGRRDPFAIQHFLISKRRWMRWGFYYILIISILLFAGKEQTFIYFQF
jgi:D-alanyl-lipoteichoic acid acyltransferase DltB (MBOAT superfamily)